MRIATGKVIDGKVVVEGDPLVEGTTVTILASDDETFELAADDESELIAALAEAEHGEGVDGDEFLRQLEQ